MAAAAALGLYRHVFIHEWPAFVDVALVADKITAGEVVHLAQRRRAVNVMAIAALDKSFLDPVVIGFGKIRLRRAMAAVTELRRRLGQKTLRLFGVVRGMAVQASNIVARVGRTREV